MLKPKVLFLCTGNSRRTQRAEGFPRAMAGDRFDVMGARQEPKPVKRFPGQRVSYLVPLCDRENERSSPAPGARRHSALRRSVYRRARIKRLWQ